jgi:DNA polymerase-1
VVVVDGTNTLYRAFFAIPPLRAPDGTPTNAALGFVNSLLKTVREESPDHVIVVLDARGKTFRHEMYDEYKAGRDATPEDLSSQIPLLREILDAYHVPILEVPGVEADDVIATLVERAPDSARVAIVSTDKDLMQLVSERVTLLDGIKDRRYQPADVEERFGVPPGQILDLRALVGDPSDNIPGVKGIGAKGAAKLIKEWETLDALLENAEDVKPTRAKNALESGADDARLSKELATLRGDVPLPGDWKDWSRQEPDTERLRELFTRLGFTRLLDALDETGGAEAAGRGEVPAVEVQRIESKTALAKLVRALGKRPSLSLRFVCEGDVAVTALPIGIAIAGDVSSAVYVPLQGGKLDLATVAETLAPLLAAPGKVAWVSGDGKRIQALFAEQGVTLAPPWFDVVIAADLIDSGRHHDVATVAGQYVGQTIQSWEQLAGRGAKAVPASQLPLDDLERFATSEACAIAALVPKLQARLEADGLTTLFEEVELPLTRVLAEMERAGVRVDEQVLEALSAEYTAKLGQVEKEIYRLAGEEFLISSTKQLQHILFEKLKLPVLKKTKTGYSTDEGVLEQLALQHDLPAQILAYRRLAKLKSTYVDALPPLVCERTGRIHPTFNQLGAATGRLSATNPNVQNIPIRTEEGIRIREAFVPAEGCRLVSADYSQVELRILAHYCGDASLVEAFRKGDDIHRRTAAEVWEVAPEEVSDEMRARAKAVNFGIIYGLSAFGLANQLGIASEEAKETIDTYFERYQGVRGFIDDTILQAKEQGFVTTLLGRRRHLPDLSSRNRVLRQAAERMAVNTVIQGTAADLIKKAMLAVQAALELQGSGAKLLLQVHDELVLDVPSKEVEAVSELLRTQMEGVLSLGVPLQVDVGVGGNWREAH